VNTIHPVTAELPFLATWGEKEEKERERRICPSLHVLNTQSLKCFFLTSSQGHLVARTICVNQILKHFSSTILSNHRDASYWLAS
jgi:hypothetical protein